MADGTSPYADNEVFFGQRTFRELAISSALGQNYFSPRTPRGARSNLTDTSNVLPSALPDVLNGSTRASETHSDAVNSSQISGLNGTSSVIDLDSDSDDVQIISDNESFLMNEKETFESDKVIDSENKNSFLNENSSDKDKITGSRERESCQPGFSTDSDSLSNAKSSLSFTSQKEHDSICSSNKSDHQNSDNESSLGKVTQGYMSIDALLAASKHLENNPNFSMEEETNYTKEPPKENSSTISKEFSLNGISDSVLNFSHGSSLENSRAEPHQGLLANAVYEDISYDVDQMLESITKTGKADSEELDLHMSVQEVDFQVKSFEQCQDAPDISQSTFFHSCSNLSNSASYYSVSESQACPPGFKVAPSSFLSYRQTVDESLLDGVEQIKLEVNDENVNETSFEVIAQTRQNSFTPSVQTESSSLQDAKGPETSKTVSKPVSTHIPMLKPSKLQIKSKTTTNNYTWAKSLPRLETKKPTPTLTVSSAVNSKTNASTPISKIPKFSHCSGSKTPLTNQNNSKTNASTPISKIPKFSHCSGSKTPLTNKNKRNIVSSEKKPQITPNFSSSAKTGPKTPLLSSHSKSNNTPSPNSTNKSKVAETSSHLKPPVKKICLSGKKNGSTLKEKDCFKNVISPVKVYINNSPSLMQRKAIFVTEERKESARNANVQAPEKMPKMKPMIVQKLTYGNNQENVDPNYTRDTLPPRIFEHANAVFMKESEPPKRHLPKIGEKMMRLIDTPRPKVIHHEGRVNETPIEKGILIPNIVLTASTPDQVPEQAGRISVRVVKPTEP